MLSGINKQQQTCSILVDNFNAQLSKWCSSDKDNNTRQDIYISTATSCYTQMIGQLTRIINDKLSYIGLLFTTNSKLLPQVEQTIYDKCHHNII